MVYVSQIEELLSIDAATIKYEKGKITLVGKENVILFELCQRIYSCSKWLKFVCHYVEGNDIEDIANNSYLSLGSCYRYKKRLDEYLIAIGKKNALSHHINDENIYRMLKTYLFFLTGEELSFIDEYNCKCYETEIYDFINKTCLKLQRKYFSESCEYIKLALFIAIDEINKKYSLRMPQRLKEDLNLFPILKIVKKNLLDTGLDTIISNEDEIVAITLLFIQLPYITTTIDVFEIEFSRINSYYLENIPEYEDLIARFRIEFGEENIDTLIFYKSIITYIETMALDYQEFLPEQEEILEEKDLALKDKISNVIKSWMQECLKEEYHIRDKCINKLANRISFILNGKTIFWVKIVASSDFEYKAIKDCISSQECTCEFIIEPETYYNLSQAIKENTRKNQLIVCTNDEFYFNEKNAIKVNLKTLRKDIIKGLQKYELI
ncbi:hypothetical protein AB6871_08660 [Carnobacterium maltaromaticum]|uniref:hypothetical protein n=1 Tax=Carnobacterium maltaromaticum TaxID=2751 RepID=UPI0039BEA84F